jgi:hypothetical protein
VDDTPLDQLLFTIEYSLTKEYPALSPFDIEERSFFLVMDLLADTRRVQIEEKKQKDPNRIIRRPAGDDWF